MNGKQKVIIILAIVWACVFFSYGLSSMNFTMINQQASQYNSGGFKAISNMATGYFNDTNMQLKHMPKLTP